MSISIDEMLSLDFFKDYKLLAGQGGITNKLQGVAILDAPDGFNWTVGREFVITSGYVFRENPDSLMNFIRSDNIKKISGLGIKLGRYIETISEEVIKEFDKFNIPLISIPIKDSWMSIMNEINVAVMNKAIRQFNIGKINPKKFSDFTYQTRKINKILSAVEYEMNFPAMIYDVSTNTAHYSSSKFRDMSKEFKIEDFWNPSFNYSKEVLCDNLKMARYRFYDEKYIRPFSWITVPIKADDTIKAYFVVMEAIDLIDYFDQFAIRIAFLLFQSIYEQITVAKYIGDSGFEDFVSNILNNKFSSKEEVIKSARELKINTDQKFYMLVMKQLNKNVEISNYRKIVRDCITKSFQQCEFKSAIIEKNTVVFLVEEKCVGNYLNDGNINRLSNNLLKRLEIEIEDLEVKFGFSDIPEYVTELKRNYERALKSIDLGENIFPNNIINTYTSFGAIAWIDIKEDEIDVMLKDVKCLLEQNDKNELVETLKAYLDNKMNYSITAEKLFVHINTVRKRIDKINDILNIDFDNGVNRLKIELILKLL